MLTPADLAPAATVLRAGVCFGLFMMVAKPENTTAYRRPFWITLIVIAGIGVTGLRPFFSSRIDSWAGFASLFQAIFNAALIALLLLRYRWHVPHDGGAVRNSSAASMD